MCERVFGVEEFLGGGCLRWIGGSGYRILLQNFREKGMREWVGVFSEEWCGCQEMTR